MKKNALIIMVLTVLSKVFGLARDMVLSYYYGTSSISDVYLIALTIPMVIFAIVGTAISIGFIPMYTNIVKISGEAKADKFTSNLINSVILLSTLVIIISYGFAKEIVSIFAFGFTGEILSLAIFYTRIAFLSVYFTGLVYIFIGYLQIKENYVIPALIGIPMNIVFIISIVLSVKVNSILLPVGIVLAYLAQFLFLLPSVKINKFSYSLSLDVKNENIVRMVKLAVPVMIGVSVNQLSTLVDRTLASSISVGGISALNYANRVNVLVQGVIVASIATAIFPCISDMALEKNYTRLKKTIRTSILAANILIVPATIGTLIFAEPIVTLLYGRGAFDQEAIKLTSISLICYSIGMVAFGLREILSRFFFAIEDTKTPMINSSIGMIINIILNVILSHFIGIPGLALATSISGMIIALFMIKTLKDKIGSFGIKQISISFMKILFASFGMGGLAKLSFNCLGTFLSQNFSLLMAIGIGAMSYFVIIYFMRIEEVDIFSVSIKKKLGIGGN